MKSEKPAYFKGIKARLNELDANKINLFIEDNLKFGRKHGADSDAVFLTPNSIVHHLGMKKRDLDALTDIGALKQDKHGCYQLDMLMALFKR